MRPLTLLLLTLLLAVPSLAQPANRYGLPELGISLVRSDLSGASGNLAGSTIPALSPFGAIAYARAGLELDEYIGDGELPVGVQFSTDEGVSLDVGTPTHWMVSVFADVEAAEPAITGLRRPGVGLTAGLRGTYTYDLYNGGIEIARTAPLDFHGDTSLAQPFSQAGNMVRIWGGVIAPFTTQFELTARAELAFADQAYNRTYFGVTPDQANEASFDANAPGAGFVYGALSLRGRYLLDNNWAIQGTARLVKFLGEAEKSPIIIAASDWQTSIDLGVVYRF